MQLKNLVEKYDGIVTFDVYRAIEGGTEEVVTFSSEDAGAIKDTVLNSTVAKYSIDVSLVARTTNIKVVLNAADTDSDSDAEAGTE